MCIFFDVSLLFPWIEGILLDSPMAGTYLIIFDYSRLEEIIGEVNGLYLACKPCSVMVTLISY